MEEYQVESLEQLVQMFEKRDEDYDISNEGILDKIHDPLLIVIAELFNTTQQHITWTMVDIQLPMLLLVCNVEYQDAADIPHFVNVVSPPLTDENSLIRKITVGLPIVMVFASKERVKEYLETTIQKTLDKATAVVSETKPSVALTTDQALQLFMYRKQNKGKIH